MPVLIWNLAVLFGTGYVVFGLGHSGWWFVLAVFLFTSGDSKGDNEKA